MSNAPEPEIDLELHFLPAWAKQSPQTNRYAQFEGEPARNLDRGRDRGDRPRSRPFGGPPRGGPRGQGGPGGPGRGRPDQQRSPGRDRFSGDQRRDNRPAPPPPPAPLPEINVTFVPEEHGVDSLARQIRITGRAYPLFDVAHLILQKPERHDVTLTVKKKADGAIAQPLFLCALDDSLWLAEEEAIRHALERHFATFYQPEKTQIEAPKGTYTFVAQCGLSGVILGPPNYHDYQNQLRKLHAERFARMPFEAFKARVRIVKDEAVVKKWVEDQSWRTEFVCLNVPEPLKLTSRDEVEKHFRQVHLPNIVKPVESHRMSGTASRGLRDRGLTRLLRERWEEQRRFPLQVATVLSQQFAGRGLQFFKVNKTVTHVSVARPHFLDVEATPVSEGVRRIVDFINAHQKCTHKQLLEALVPRPPAPPAAVPVPASVDGAPVAEAVAPPPPPELAAVMTDLHWLVHQGHVIEFANGVLETAKRPIVRPPKPPPPVMSPAADATPATQATAADVGANHSTSPEAHAEVGVETPAEATTVPTPAPEPAPTDISPLVETASESKPGV